MSCKICELISECGYDHCQMFSGLRRLAGKAEGERLGVRVERRPRCGDPVPMSLESMEMQQRLLDAKAGQEQVFTRFEQERKPVRTASSCRFGSVKKRCGR
ncbi:MAG: hypothetical protein ACK5LX_01005 [Oscillospiraceae bacterium]